jgi:hypothetical protein
MKKAAAILLFVTLICEMTTSYAPAGLIGSTFQISPSGLYTRFADIAFDTVDNKYLVVYTDYSATPTARVCGRFVSAAGIPLGSELCISDPTGGLFGAVAYNPTSNMFLVTWDDQRAPFPIYGQLVSGATGLPFGPNFQIGLTGGIRSAVAASSTSNNFMVVWWGSGDITGQLVSNLGTLIGTNFNVSNDSAFSGYPTVEYGASGNQYLVTWDFSNSELSGSIHGQRVDAGSGLLLGSQITVSTGGAESRSAITYDSINSRWMVAYNDQTVPANSYDQGGQIINNAGALVGTKIPFASSAEFEGDTQFGGDIAFLSSSGGRYFSSFASDSGAAGQEALASGLLINSRVVVDSGFITSSSNAADPNSNRWLLIWEEDVAGTYTIFGRFFEPADLIPPNAVTSFTTTSGSGQLTLNWTNPSDADFAGTVIRWKLGSYPAHLNDGTFLVDKPNTPGSNDNYVHLGVSGGFTYFYSAFAYDEVPNYASAAHATGVPASMGDFDTDTDVDQKDFAHLQNCLSGHLVSYGSGCVDADLDVDGDVDGADFLLFDGCMKGANQLPGC